MRKKTTLEKKPAGKSAGWFKACRVEDVPANGGACIRYGQDQIAVFYFTGRQQWFATQNLCPHRQQMSLSRGLTGDASGEPKVACPFHKKSFSLQTGDCLSDPGLYRIKTYPVKIEDGYVHIGVE
ncbi:nitrite reductase small subunit NirD [Compostibacter hankyongensis]|uniref:Nitrite reductase small subunit NirD n=1 Tax=Compostibacter hankyongensis TaxID=1007089 RepID=A0ABP8FL51_9BACT